MKGGIEEAYKIGAGVQNMMVPQEQKEQETVTIPLSTEITSADGMHNEYDDILKQTKVVSDIILEKSPERIVTLAGDASATVIPLGYLNGYYQKDTSLVWIDANPDVSVPYTMALMAWLGKRSEDFKRLWPTMVPASRILIVGYRAWNQSLKEWQDDLDAPFRWYLVISAFSRIAEHEFLEDIEPMYKAARKAKQEMQSCAQIIADLEAGVQTNVMRLRDKDARAKKIAPALK